MITKHTYTTPWCELEFVTEEDSFMSQIWGLNPWFDDDDTIEWDD